MASSILVKDLRKTYGSREVIRGLDLDIPEGKMVGLVGPNGSGKTTLFRILVGLAGITSGKVQVMGMPPGAQGVRNATGYMTQAEAMYWDLSVAENVRFFAVRVTVELLDRLAEAVGWEPARRGQIVQRLGFRCYVPPQTQVVGHVGIGNLWRCRDEVGPIAVDVDQPLV